MLKINDANDKGSESHVDIHCKEPLLCDYSVLINALKDLIKS
jgi:hypothetical protein